MKKWTNTNPMRRLLSLALSMAMVLSVLPMPSIAAEGDGLCEHHTEHTADCGYVAAVEGHDCGHQHDDSCGYREASDCGHQHDESCGYQEASPCTHQHTEECGEDGASCAHVHDESCGYAEASDCTHSHDESCGYQEASPCKHEHDGSCGYVEAVEGSPCTYQCDLCTGASEPELLLRDTVITDWEWVDEWELIDPETGIAHLPFASAENMARFDDIVPMLPAAIEMNGETLTLGDWLCPDYPVETGAYEGEYVFETTLPEGYVLADGTNVLSLTVALSAGSSEDTSSYADSDTLTNVPYYDANGTLRTCPLATKVVENKDKYGPNTTWTTGWYVVEGTVEIGGTIFLDPGTWQQKEELYKSVSVQGDVNLILKQNSELQMLHGHIDVPEDSSLTVYCDNTSNSGTLKVWNAINHAAIGGSLTSPNSGKITINGGTVTAATGNGGAGIGSGEGGSAGDITINGGNIKATANNGGAGIGTGKNGESATITINNCEKIYCHANGGAGIGSGENSSGDGKVTVNIHGGKIDAHGRDGAGIGSGENAPLSVDVYINGGDIYAQTDGLSNPASHGAAIGGGYGATNTTVNIGGSAEVDAKGGENAPGIGSINPDGCSVTISGGTVRASGGKRAAGIGGGSLKQTSCPVTITGGNVTATGGNLGAGIGSGSGDDSKTTPYSTGTIIISGGTVTAEGSYWAAGIGGGAYCTAGQIQIDGGTVIANRDASNDGDILRAAFDIGDGATGSNMKKIYTRYTLNGSAKLYLQNGYKEPNVQDAIKPSINSGYIFSGTPETYTAIRVYGSQTLNEEFCIETGKTMTVMSGASLSTGSNKLYVKGTLAKEGTGSASGNIYYPLTLTNCTAGSSNTSLYNDELFGKENATISLTPALQSGYKLDRWTVTPSSVTVSGNSFTMPQHATTVEAVGSLAVTITQQPMADQTITYGADVTLSVGAENPSGTTDRITYQWYQVTDNNNVKLPGKTSDSLTLTKPDAGTHVYFCQVTWAGISIDSSQATVKVNQATGSVTINRAPSKTYDGQPAALTTNDYSVTGDGAVTVEYMKQGETNYFTTAPTDAGSYTVRVTLAAGTNYTGDSASENFTISKAQNSWEETPTVKNPAYYGDTDLVTYEALYGNESVGVYYTDGNDQIVAPVNAGDYKVVVSLDQSDNYTGLDMVVMDLTISPRPITDRDVTVTLDSDFVYDAGEKTQTVTIQYKDKTLVKGVDYELTGDISGTDAGTYTLTITGRGNFDGTTSKTWNITEAPITPVVSLADTVYGETLSPSVTGNPGDGDVTYTYYSDAACETVVTPKDVGTYYVKASVAQTANYQAGESAAVSFRITQKALTITANDHTITYGEAPDNSGVTYDGFVNGETERVLGGSLTYTYNYSQYGDVGSSYDITPSGLTSDNYAITFKPGKLTVQKKQIGITWGDTQFTYNGSKQIPTATPTGMVNDDTITLTVSGDQTNAGTGYTATVSKINGVKAGNYALPNSVTTTFSIAKKEVTITGTTVAETKVYNGNATAQITSNGSLSDNYDGNNLTIVPGSAAYDNKNVGESKPVTFTGFSLGGSAAGNYALTGQPASVTADITAKPVTLTVTVKDKDFDGTTTAEIDNVSADGFVAGDDVLLVSGEATFPQKTPGENLSVTFTEFTLEGEDAGNYSITNPTPTGVTGIINPSDRYLDLAGNADFASQTEVWVDGVAYPIQTEGNRRYASLPKTGDLLTGYTYKKGNSTPSHENYPTSMTVYRITRETTGATLTRISVFDDLLRYSGCAIRITGKRGIRMITSLTKDSKNALKGAGLAGYTLEEYGTVAQWADELGDQSLTMSNGKSNYAYKRGKADPVFANVGDLTQYTNVLVWDSLTNNQLGQDIFMRPYIILKDADGKEVTLYGGTVSRSIGYIAYQNRNVFQPGTAAYAYVWDIIHAVYGKTYDKDYKG